MHNMVIPLIFPSFIDHKKQNKLHTVGPYHNHFNLIPLGTKYLDDSVTNYSILER